MKTQIVAVILAAFTGMVANGQAITNFQLIEPLFPAYSGAGAVPDTGTYWNTVEINSADTSSISFTMPGSVFSSDGATSSSITINSFTPSATTGNVNVFTGGESSFPLVRRDLLTTGDGQITMVIGGLTSNGEYDLYLISQNAEFHSAVTDFTIGATTQTVNNQTTTQPPFAFVPGGTYAAFSSVLADGSGTISVTYNRSLTDLGAEGAFNAFQIVAVPEPGASALLVSGMLGALVLKRRIRRTVAA